MAKARGVFKEIRYKKESAGQWGLAAGTTGGTKLRRITSNFNPTAESFTSNEINTTFQTVDTRLGVRGVDGNLNGELSPGTYSPFIASILARDFTAVTGGSALSVTIATSGTNFTITRSAGSWFTDGIMVGHVVRMTGAGLNVANQSNNALVVSMTALALTVMVLSSTSMFAEGPISSVALSPVGKVTYAPLTGHTDDSYNIEEWYSDIAQSQLFTGVKFGSVDIKLPSTGIVTTDLTAMGKGLTTTGTSAYFTSPTAASTTGLLTSVQGALLVNGTNTACITDANVKIERAMDSAKCVGSNFVSDIFAGKINVTGAVSAYFSDATMRDYFNNETEVTMVLVVTTGTSKTADFVSIVIPRLKFTNFSAQDAENGIVTNLNYVALLNSVTSAGLVGSTVMIQDSAA